ncbi:MAG: (d)CMP kinase [Proteobacteria bacterium]|nr:(d)CMP kinase [Pseudomonadota bacterium]
MIITIDGPAGAGKSTVGRELSRRLGFRFFESGSAYRALACEVKNRKIDPANRESVCRLIPFLDFFHPRPEFYLPEIGELASLLSAVPEVRKGLLQSQQKLAEGGDLVTEGRDMGSVVFPGAEHKFFLDASLSERAQRRHQELAEKGKGLKPEEVEAEISARDTRDRSRKASPLVVPAGAIVIDTTGLGIGEVVETLLRHITKGSEKRHGFPNRHSRESGNPGK